MGGARGAMTITKLQEQLLLILLIVLGLAGNYLKYPVFFSIDFLFGSIFVMLVLQIFGVRAGVIAAFVTSTVTYYLWGHPYAIVIMTCEALAVGLLTTRKRLSLVVADTVYWCFIGIPMTFLFYYGVMHLAFNNANITMLKQAINGITNALMARFIFMAGSYLSRKTLFSLREVTFNLLALFVLVPSLIGMAVQCNKELAETDFRIRESFSLISFKTAANLNKWLQHHLRKVIYLARLAGDHPTSYMQTRLEEAKAYEEDFLRMGRLDSNSNIVAYCPLIDELGHSNIGRNFADRPYVPVLKSTLKPLLGEVVMGRIGIPKPMIPMLAPVITKGQYAGFVIGILNIDALDSMLALNTKAANLPGLVYTLLDKNDNVIVSSRRELEPMAPFRRGKGELTNLGNGMFEWLPAGKPNISISERWRKAVYIKETAIGGMSEWKLLLEQPILPFQIKLYSEYTLSLVRLFIVLLAALILAELLSRRITVSLEKLKGISSGLPAKIASGEDIVWENNNIVEVRQLTDNLKEISQVLGEQFETLRVNNEELEKRVSDRTLELKEANDLLQSELAERKRMEEQIRRSLKEKDTLLREIHHRVKNNMAVVSSLLALQANNVRDCTVKSLLDESQQRIKSMALVHEKLYQTTDLSSINFKYYINSLMNEIISLYHINSDKITTEIRIEDIELDLESAVPCGLILNELLTNAFKHAFPDNRSGVLVVHFVKADGSYRLTIKDNGVGLPEGFDYKETSTLGLKIVNVLARQLTGRLQIKTDNGTEAVVEFTAKKK